MEKRMRTPIGMVEVPSFTANKLSKMSDKELLDSIYSSRTVCPFEVNEASSRGILKRGDSKQCSYKRIGVAV